LNIERILPGAIVLRLHQRLGPSLTLPRPNHWRSGCWRGEQVARQLAMSDEGSWDALMAALLGDTEA
jgi:hypothetical protein